MRKAGKSAPYAEFGPVFIRVLIGFHLFYGNWGRLVQTPAYNDFVAMLARTHFPLPSVMAYVSAGAQVVCGILYMAGLFTRPAAAAMVVNFVLALVMVHWGQPYPRQALALIMLCTSLFLLLHGPGRLALDNVVRKR
jgi:putative oxidoreductase